MTIENTDLATTDAPSLAAMAAIRQEITRCVEAGDIPGLRDLHAKARGYEAYLQEGASMRADAAEVQRCAAELVIRIERGLGEVLRFVVRPGNVSKAPGAGCRIRLDVLGVTRKQSARWKQLARVPEDVFEQRLVDAVRVGGRLGAAAILRPERTTSEDPPKGPPDVAEVARRFERWGAEWCELLAHELLARAQRRAS